MSLFKTGLRYLLRRPLQSILCILGVALGVAVVIAIDLANGSASRAFELSTETVAGKATHQIVGSNDGLDVAVYRRIKTELGVAEAAPVVTAYATAIELDQQPVRVLGIDIFAEGPFRSYLGEGGSAFRQNGLAQFLTEPRTLLIGEATAQRYALQSGMTLTLRIGNARTPFRIIGILQPTDDNSRRALDGIAIMDIGAAQALFGMSGKLSHIDLIADERTEAGRARLAEIQTVLPAGVQITKPSTRSQSVESLTDAFKLNLTALSLLALVVGMFLIYNTITFSVVQRRPTIGTLRCLGVTRGEIFRMILLETLLLGTLGGLLGVGFGIVLGRGAVGLVTQTINDLYYVVNVRDIAVDPLTLLKGFVLGVGAALLAALAPAYEATSIPPVGALRRSSIEGRVRRLLPYVAAVGVALFLIGGAMLLLTKVLVVNLGGIFGVLIGIALISPLITILFMRIASPVLGRLIGIIGRMAPRGVVNSISRTAIAIASLLVAVSVIIGLQSMIGSFRNTVQSWLDVSLAADIFITPPSSGVGDAQSAIAPEIIDEFRALPGAGDVTLLRRVSIETQVLAAGTPSAGAQLADDGWRTTTLTAIESIHERPDKEFLWSERPVDGIWASMTGQDEVQVSEPFANKFGVTQQNNLLAVRTNAGARTMRVVGVFYDYASDAGVVRLRRDLYQRYWADDKVSSIALYLPSGSPITAQSLRAQFAGRDLLISANRELRDSALQVFDRTFAITSALNLLATVVAFIGVLSALMALQIERTRELGMLRANGMTLRQLWQLTLLETGLMGGTAGILSMPAGLLLAIILVYIINLRSFGWTIRLDLQWTTFAQALAVAVVSALLAAIYPMLRLGKLAIASAVRQE